MMLARLGLRRAGALSVARTAPALSSHAAWGSRSSRGSHRQGRQYSQGGSRSSSSSAPVAWAAVGAAGAAVASLVLLKRPAYSLAPSVPDIVHENETGQSFPTTLRVPPTQCDIGPWRGSRPGFVFQNGPKGLGYYADRYRGGTSYVMEPSSSSEQVLVGVGMRCMLQRCQLHIARAYAIGCYVEEASMARDDPTAALHAKVNKTLRLVMAREVKGGHIGKGFDRTLIPKLRNITNEKNGIWKEHLRTFTRAFNRCGTLHPGAEVLFCMPGDGSLTIFINGSEAEKIQSEALCDAVMEMYMGEKNVAPRVHDNFVEGFNRAYEKGLRSMGVPPGSSIENPFPV